MSNTAGRHFLRSLRFRYGLVLLAVIAGAGYFFWDSHQTHILEYLPLVLALGLCVGMHAFMHGGHGGNSKD